jgi:3',5'-nucleoside bisphosphate phosphatase
MTRSPSPGTEAPLLCELHAHTTWSDGSLDLDQVVDLYGRRGFDVLSITDHVVRGDDMLTAGRYPAYLAAIREETRRADALYGMLVIPGSS